MRREQTGFVLFIALLGSACDLGDGLGPALDPLATRASAIQAVLTSATCGQTILSDLRLEEDLNCAADGLFIGADGVSIDLNGHTISGSATGVGITVQARQDVTIKGGTIRNFVSGIVVASATDITIKDSGLTENREAFFIRGSVRTIVKNNTIWANTLRGVMIRPTATANSVDTEVVANTITDTPSGILVFGQSDNTIKENIISGSTFAAIDLNGTGGSGNIIKGNLLANSAAGVRFTTGIWTGNTFAGNTIQLNVCGVQGTSDGNLFRDDNVFMGNVADICP